MARKCEFGSGEIGIGETVIVETGIGEM